MNEQKYGYLPDGTKIDPGEGWEIVPPETVYTTDCEWEYTDLSGKHWFTFGHTAHGFKANDWDKHWRQSSVVFRRRIKQEQPKWHKITKDCLPESNRKCWMFSAKLQIPVLFNKGWEFPGLVSNNFSHWMYCSGNYQVPPAPEVDEDEEAFDEALHEYISWDEKDGFQTDKLELKQFWLAGREYENGKSK